MASMIDPPPPAGAAAWMMKLTVIAEQGTLHSAKGTNADYEVLRVLAECTRNSPNCWFAVRSMLGPETGPSTAAINRVCRHAVRPKWSLR